jgi:hypothetical protein
MGSPAGKRQNRQCLFFDRRSHQGLPLTENGISGNSPRDSLFLGKNIPKTRLYKPFGKLGWNHDRLPPPRVVNPDAKLPSEGNAAA